MIRAIQLCKKGESGVTLRSNYLHAYKVVVFFGIFVGNVVVLTTLAFYKRKFFLTYRNIFVEKVNVVESVIYVQIHRNILY